MRLAIRTGTVERSSGSRKVTEFICEERKKKNAIGNDESEMRMEVNY
jgi:hypothetical protein